jgi:outer membrane protein OmpA-like peptidoglycan-associated protein
MGENAQINQEREIAALKMRNIGTQVELEKIQGQLDDAAQSEGTAGVYQVFFDEDATSLRSGAIANLEVFAESLKRSPNALVVNVVGHTDDTGAPEYNDRLALARATSVTTYLAGRGIATDRIKTSSEGAAKPIGSNLTPSGRQLNRRVDVFISR